jgi:hypothetical protein
MIKSQSGLNHILLPCITIRSGTPLLQCMFIPLKRKRLQRSAPVLDVEPPTEELMDARKRQLEAIGLNAMIH